MTELLVNGYGVSTICRLCLSRGEAVLDIFVFSTKVENQIADVIMTCAPVKITKNDGMPNFICQLCYRQLEKIHQFQMQVVQSDKTLRRYLHQLGGPDKQIKITCFTQKTSENPSIYESNADITVKCEPLELCDVIDNIAGPTNNYSLSSTECANDTLLKNGYSEISCEDTKIAVGAFDEDTNVSWKEKEPGKFNPTNKISDQVSLKFENQTDNVLIRPEYINDTRDTSPNVNVKCESLELLDVSESLFSTKYASTECANDTLLKNGYSEISCEDTKIAVGAVDEDTNVSWKEKEPGKFNPTNKISDQVSLKFENQTDNVFRPEYINDTKDTSDNINVKCESLELLDVSESLFSTEYADDNFSKNDNNEISCEDTKIGIGHILNEGMNDNWKDEEPGKFNSADKIKREVSSESEHQADSMLFRLECINNTFYGNDSEIGCEDTKDNGHSSGNFGDLRSVYVKCDKLEENNQNTSINTMKHEKDNGLIKKPYRGDACNQNFSKSNVLKYREGVLTDKKPYQCDVCVKSFTVNWYLIRHKRTHATERPHRCEVCNKSYTTTSYLKAHKLTHSGLKPHKCDVCNKCYINSSELKAHSRLHTGEKSYKCDVCKKGFTRSSVLNIHKRRHTGVKPYNCDVCNKGFYTSDALNFHKNTHTGEKPHKCDVCNKSYAHPCNLSVHKRIHTGEKPYKCDVCIKSFTTTRYLNVHKRTHTGVKLYKCDVCNNCFTTSSSLNIHKRIHTGEKPYMCDVCYKNFVSLGQLKAHKRTHTGKKS